MKQVLAFFIVLLAMAACTGKQQAEKPGNALDQYADSITKVYPNYSGNIAVVKMICEDFEKHISPLPGVLDGKEFHVVGISDIGGKTSVMFACSQPSVSVWCEDYGTENAAKLDQSKNYRITGGTIDRYEPERGIAQQWLTFGSIFVNGLTVEEY